MTLYKAYTNSKTTFEDVVFIGGSDYTFEFVNTDYYGNKAPITSYSAIWYLAEYGNTQTTIFEKACDVKDDYTFTVTLPKSVTLQLHGVYTQQLEIILPNGGVVRTAQGTVVIRKGTPSFYEGGG